MDLSKYEVQDIIRFEDALSLIMLIDKIRTPNGISIFGNLPLDYFEKLKASIPPHLYKLLADVITVLLKRINVPDDEIDEVTGQLYKRRIQEMLTMIEHYDVQKTRQVAREEGREEGIEKGKYEVAESMMADGDSIEKISRNTKIPINDLVKYFQLEANGNPLCLS